MSERNVNIDYGRIVRRSIDLIQKNKWLWVYGLTLAIFSGGSGSGGGSSSGSSRTKTIPQNLPKDLPEKAEKVMGLTTNFIKEWFSSVPLTTWIAIGIGIVFVILLWIILSWIIQSWAKGGLIAGFEDAENDKPVNLLTTSPRGIGSVKNLILYSIISGLVALGTILILVVVSFLVIGGGYLVLKSETPTLFLWFILSITIAAISFIIFTILFSMISIYAERLIVLKGYRPWDAWKKGLSMSKGNFLPTVIMGVINTTIGCFGGCLGTLVLLVILGIPALILLFPIFTQKEFRFPPVPTTGGIVILFFLFITLLNLVKAAFILLNFSNWNLFFKEVWKKENES